MKNIKQETKNNTPENEIIGIKRLLSYFENELTKKKLEQKLMPSKKKD